MFNDRAAVPATIVFISRDGQVGGCSVPFGELLSDPAKVCRRTPTSSMQKVELIEELVSSIDDTRSDAHRMLCQKAALMLDEMLENAFFAAPRDVEGRALFTKGTCRSLLPTETVTLSYCFDGQRLVLEVRDSWGTLTPERLFSCLALNVAEQEPDAERAGRGLFFMWRLMDQLYVSINPGRETTVGGCLLLNETAAECCRL